MKNNLNTKYSIYLTLDFNILMFKKNDQNFYIV